MTQAWQVSFLGLGSRLGGLGGFLNLKMARVVNVNGNEHEATFTSDESTLSKQPIVVVV